MRKHLSLAVVLAFAACGPPAPKKAPEPVAEPPEAAPAPAADAPDHEPGPRPEAAAPPTLRICAGGDVMLGTNLDTRWAGYAAARLGRPVAPLPDPDSLLRPLRPLIADADIVLLNIEGAVGAGPAPAKCRPGSRYCYAFRQPPGVAPALAGVACPARLVVNLANNHAMDAGSSGFDTTVALLSESGIAVTGVDTLATVVATAGGDSVAFLGFSTAVAGPDPRDLEAVHRHVSRAAARHPYVVVTMHMGAEGRGAQRTPDRNELFLGEDRGNSVAFARAAVRAGAALVVGHGPHVLRAHEWLDGALIVYSLGNLLTYGPFSMDDPLDRGAVVCADVDGHARVARAVLRSTRQMPPGILSVDSAARAAFLVDSLSRLDFPETAGRVTPEGTILRPEDRPSRPASESIDTMDLFP